MSSNFMQSTAELCFADRDHLPSYMQAPERRTSYRSNPDTDEAQRYFGAENDFDYLVSAESRQDDEEFEIEDDDIVDEADEDDFDDGDELLDAADAAQDEFYANYVRCDAEDKVDDVSVEYFNEYINPEPLHPVRWAKRLVRCDKYKYDAFWSNRMDGYCCYVQVLATVRPRLEAVDADEHAEAQRSKSDANEASMRCRGRNLHAREGTNSKPRRAHGTRVTVRRMALAARDTLETRRLDHLFTEIAADRKSAKRAHRLAAA